MKHYFFLALILSVMGCTSIPASGDAPSKAVVLPLDEKGVMMAYTEYAQRTERDAVRLNSTFAEWAKTNRGIYEEEGATEEGLARLDALYQSYLQEYNATAKPHTEEFKAFVLESEEALMEGGVDTYATLEMLRELEQQAENNLVYMRSSRKKLSLGTLEFRQGS